MSWAMKMAVWGRTSSWGHRRTWKSCSLVCWRSPWAFSLLCPSCNTNNSQSPCKRTSKTVLLLSPFARCGRPPQRGCQLPQQQPQPTPLSPLHFTIVTFLRIVLLSNIVGYLLLSLQLFQGLFCTHYITTNASGQKDQFCYQKIANDSGPRSLKHLTKAGEDETNQKYCKYSPLPEKGFHKI